jgi:hypothetical protein
MLKDEELLNNKPLITLEVVALNVVTINVTQL